MRQNDTGPDDELTREASAYFQGMVDSVGVKRFSSGLGLSTRQVNRMLSGAQPNPIERLIRALQCTAPEAGDRSLDYICQQMGGFFVREEAIEAASVNAVRECAEAIAAISDGEISRMDEIEIREAVEALICLARAVQAERSARSSNEPVKTS